MLFNQSLQYIYDNPTELNANGDVPRDFGNYDVALPNNSWDVVVFQPYYDPQIAAPIASTLGTDIGRIKDFVTLTKSSRPQREHPLLRAGDLAQWLWLQLRRLLRGDVRRPG